ncbi:MAG: LPS-assembly protein LptD [Geminicoccaceae bacterium]
MSQNRARRRPVAAPALAAALLLATPAALAQTTDPNSPEQSPSVLTSDTLTYDTESEVVVATGNVEISTGERRLLADEVRYDQRADKMRAIGNVVLIQPNGDAIFGKEVEITGDLQEGFVQAVGMLLNDDSRIAANRADRYGGNVVDFDRAVYSPCPLCADEDGGGGALWQIKARRVILDEKAQTVTYRDARMELFGVPVAYTPWFRHPAPGVARQSGFLTPTFGTTSELGATAQIPYYYVIDQSSDATIAPIFTQKGGTVLAGEYRRLHRRGYTQLAGAATYAVSDESDHDAEQGHGFRGYFRGIGGYSVSDHSQAGYDAYLSSDDTFLDRYQIDDASVLRSRAFLEGFENRNFWSLNGYYFQGLAPFYDQDTIPVALPLGETRFVSERYWGGSYFTADSNVLALTRKKGLDTRRLSQRVGWTLPYVGPIGDVYSLDVSLRGDVYNTDGDPSTFSSEGGEKSEGRVLPRISGQWSWPLADWTGSWVHEVEPTLTLNLAPTWGNTQKIPNEDSSDFEFDETNLFEEDRFAGLDRIDTGSRVAYGLRFSSYGPRATEFSGVFGQSYSFTENDYIPPESGVQDNLSDFVGAFYVRPSPLLDLSYRYRLGKSDLKFRRQEAIATFGPSFLRFNVNYVNLSREPEAFDDERDTGANPFGFESREEITLGVRVKLTDQFAIGGQTRRDLSAGETIANQAGLIYTHPCLILAVGFEQRFTPDAELGDETAFMFRIAFKNLADFETGGSLFGSESGEGG